MSATLLFDLDGTLVETDHLHLQAFQTIFTPFGVDIDWDVYRARILGRENALIAADLIPDVPVERHPAVMDAKEQAYRDLVGEVEEAAGLTALLDWADAHAIPCGVVTNAPRANANLLLNALRIGHRFRTVVVGAELARAKPHPLPYLTALERLGGEASRSTAFEDSPSGASAAVAAGLGVAGMVTTVPEARLREVGASVVARDFNDPALLAFVRDRALGARP